MQNTNYDFIGDVHGHADALKDLLHQLGYQRRGGLCGLPSAFTPSGLVASTKRHLCRLVVGGSRLPLLLSRPAARDAPAANVARGALWRRFA